MGSAPFGAAGNVNLHPSTRCRTREPLARVFVRDNGRSSVVEPVVAIRVVEVPMCVDQVLDRIVADAGKGLCDSGPGHGDAGIDQQFAIRSREAPRCCRRSPAPR